MIEFILFFIGLVLLVKGAGYVVTSSEHIALKLKIPSLVIGLTIVAIGTSIPELSVNIVSALEGSTGIGLGNIIGSNIANTLLILGIASLIRPVKAKHSTVWKEIPFNLGAVLLFLVLANDSIFQSGESVVSRGDGIVLFFFLFVFGYYIYLMAKQRKVFKQIPEGPNYSTFTLTLMAIGGLIAIIFGSNFVVDGAVAFARLLGVREFIIGATMIAVGTSLPELATAIVALRKRHNDLLLGNVIGSNIFNILLVLGITAIITPIPIKNLQFHFLYLLASTLLLIAAMFLGRKHTIDRFGGVVFLIAYVGYVWIIII